MKKTISIGFVILCLIFSNFAVSQVSKTVLKQKKEALMKQRANMSREEINDYYQKMIKRVPSKLDLKKMNIPTKEVAKSNSTKTPLAVPNDMIFPIESDEVQAILMTWIYDTRNLNGDYAEQLFDGWGLPYSGGYTLEQVVSAPDTATNSDYAKLFAHLANGIQQHTQVWINIWAGEDSTAIKQYMINRGTPLTNYRFFVHPGNSFWYRDCGPVAFYYGDNDSIAFMDFEYYGGRPLDDQIPKFIGQDMGFPVYTNTIEYEGGNILLDGVGSLFTSSAVYDNNEDSYGLYYRDSTSSYGYSYQTKSPLTESQVRDSLTHLLNLTRCTVLPALQYDGGTGHIDLYADMWEETGFVAAQYPPAMSALSDAVRVEKNLDTMTSKLSYFGSPYAKVRIPLPAKNNGQWYTSQSQYNSTYTRAFSNHTFVNNAIMQPVFCDATLSGSNIGDTAGNRKALEIMSDCYPGYHFEAIDVRAFDGFGGALHCITKQIPAENPVRIYHNPIRWFNPNQMNGIPTLNILSQNRSGINHVTVYYKNINATTWDSITCNSVGNNMYQAVLNSINFASTTRDTLIYYISSTSNNGKTITKPMTAPQGYYKLIYGTDVYNADQSNIYASICCQPAPKDFDNIGQIYPNPASSSATVTLPQSLTNDNLSYKIINLKGQVLSFDKIAKGSTSLTIDVHNFSSGAYWVVFSDGNLTQNRKLIIAK
jgi:agmatine/peptidylarginine deiminase